MNNIIQINCADDYNKLFGLETLHPLVSIVDFSESTIKPEHLCLNYGMYALFLKDTKCGDIRYGRKIYDYREGTIVSFAPGQISEIVIDENAKLSGFGVLFHPDLIRGTALGAEIRQYSFFSYESTEALHVSERERSIIMECFNKIQQELDHPIDKHTKRLVSRNIELLLDYCLRFYERQFITRSDADNDILTKFEKGLNEYFEQSKQLENGIPTVKYFADKACLSPNYFGDYIKKTTGRTPQDYIQTKVLSLAKEKLVSTNLTVSQISYELGFQYPQHFSRVFKSSIGMTPNEYRVSN